ncbi:TlpA disulfide reductase family protein [Flavobacterium sp. H122]|uniref:TlpA disulfide reductase family protein n=1 Tax=Flavobacterium sp. H122 TaxID=2529860 RepID=UPI0010AB06A4|nr:TlpA disulfide reductase family protein [Flavobacterium sp. H122]
MKIFFVFLFGCFSALAQNGIVNTDSYKLFSSNGIEVKSYDFKSFEKYLNRYDEKTYVINFWATWCLPCVKELPYFESLNNNFKDKNVEVILVSLDMPQKIGTGLLPFIEKKKLKSVVVHLNDPDANAWIEKVDKNWSGAIPATVIYNAKNRKFYEQSFTYEELEKEVQSFIQ